MEILKKKLVITEKVTKTVKQLSQNFFVYVFLIFY